MTGAPTDRIIDVLEYLMNASPGPVKQVTIARDLGMSSATLSRIVRILSDRGYLFRTSEKYLIKNFSLERIVPMSEAYLEELDGTLGALRAQLGVAVEVIVVTGHELLWHSRAAHPDPDVTIWAREGFRRSLFEFDALSRLYLSTLPPERLRDGFYIGGFFDTSKKAGRREIAWLEADAVQAAVEAARGAHFACDAEGNHFGIRRFVTVVRDPSGRFLHLLSLADPLPIGAAERERAFEAALEEERIRLEAVLVREQHGEAIGASPRMQLVR
ncbi:MarR family transcriptional regulator [Cereibacter changlensis]|uniref:MarR family transcriptional regulator n=1 Tax=Cereibacter changlensis TaxID=402884 RepID=A0A4U0Z4W1_9RHOB|nr:helix-turn-helix domain-containing protein [Cereibacter changlensis]TKA98296.1 MarR family transcriptional regulator [Cereibacter changlensis]